MADFRTTPIQAAVAERYTILQQIGAGGMGVVYLAKDVKHDRDVALKVFRPELSAALGVERFLREIQLTARLQHPHVLPLYDSGNVGGFLYYVMPYVVGESLRERLMRDRRLAIEEALAITGEVADALGYAHAQGVVHRDVKPENIMLSGGHALVADFGIARAISACAECEGPTLTAVGLPIGTPAYMSPEQATGAAQLDGRSDLYSLGCVLYEMLAGRPPFTGPTMDYVVRQHVTADPPPVTALRPDVPEDLARAVHRALAKTPADRHATAADFLAALGVPAAHIPAVRRTPVGPAAGPPPRRLPHRTTVAAVGAGALVLFVVAAAWGPISALFRERVAAAAGEKKEWVLVAEFDGPAGDPMLTASARDLVAAALDQSPVVATVPRDQIRTALRLAGKSDTARVHPDLARELAYRSAVRAVVAGSVSRVGQGYSIIIRVLDAEDGHVLLSASDVAASDAELVASLGRLAGQVRERLGERKSAIASNRPLVQVTTPSFDAYRKYVEGLEVLQEGDYSGGMVLLGDALALDPDFAAAWAMRGTIFLRNLNVDSATAAFAAALRRPDRLTEGERRRLEALTAWLTRYDLAAALTAFELLARGDPNAPDVHQDHVLILEALGRYEEALAAAEAARRAAPFGSTHEQMALPFRSLVALGRLDEARRLASGFPGTHRVFAEMVLAAADEQWDRAEIFADTLANDAGAPFELRGLGVAALAAAQAARGAVDAAHRTLDGLAAVARQNGHASGARWVSRAQLLLRLVSGREIGAPPPSLAPDTSAAGVIVEGLWAAAGGDTTHAWRLLRAARGRPRAALVRVGSGPDVLEALIHRRGGRWADVVRLLGPAARRGEDDPVLLDREMLFTTRWIVADAYERLGRLDSAAAYFELVTAPTRMLPITTAVRGFADSFAHQRLALIYARQQRTAAALRQAQRFTASFTTPDPDLVPLVSRVRAALQGLGG